MNSRKLDTNGLAPELEAFFSDLIHDLRNLLDGITMLLPRGDQERLPHEATFRSLYDVLRKVEDFHDRLHGLGLGEGTAELGPTLQETLNALHPFVRDRTLDIDVGDGVWVAVEPRALRKIVENVLHVIVKRTVAQQTIRGSVARDDAVVLSLETRGPTTLADAERLLSPSFENGADLWVSRARARAAGGELSYTTEGDRLQIRLTLPGTEPDQGAEADKSSHPTERVLVVDDNVDSAKSMVILLSAAGFETESCHDGASALELASSFAPDALVLDLGLPVMDGFEVCRRLRREPGGENLLVLALSGRNDDETVAAVHEAGFDELFVKPVDPRVLIERMRP